MMSQTWWYVARAGGIVAWALGIATVLTGTALATRALGKRPRGPWIRDLHRFLGGFTLLFVGLHVGALVADSYEHFGLADVLVPFASGWKPLAVAAGVVAMWLLVAIELTSLGMRHLPTKVWRGIHLSAYVVAFLTSVHMITAGTDAGSPILQVAAFAWMPLVVLLLLPRILGSAGGPAPVRGSSRAPAGGRVGQRQAPIGRSAPVPAERAVPAPVPAYPHVTVPPQAPRHAQAMVPAPGPRPRSVPSA